jgi:glycosidase
VTLAAAALAAVVATGTPAPATPTVLKVEPPSWWARHSIDPVRLLVRGGNLAGARLDGAPGIAVSNVSVNGAGTYAFADVAIDDAAVPGPRELRLATPDGESAIRFEVLPPLAREGRFQGFSPDDVLYLVMPDRFANGDPSNDDPPRSAGLLDRGRARYYHGGDLRGLRERLPYLDDLGVTTIWMTPVYDNHDRLNERERYDGQPITDYHGYGAVDLYAVDEHLGDMAELRALVDAAHARGMKVVQDQVANHTGPYHPWTTDPPTPTWYAGTPERHLRNVWQTWTLADPYATPELQRETLRGWFIDILPDLDQDDPEVRRYLIQNSLWWVGLAGFDGIRQDTLPYVPRSFWREWTAAVEREFPRVTILGEFFDGDPALVSFFQGGRAGWDGVDTGIDTLFDFPLFYPARRAFGEGKGVKEVAMMLARDHVYPDASVLVTHLGLHDTGRFLGDPGATTAGLELAYTFLFTTRGTPLVYYGDEIAMRGGGDPDNRRDFPGGWPGDAANAFDAAGRTPEQDGVWRHVRALAHLRRELAPLRRGRLAHLAVSDQVYVYARVMDGAAVLVAINNGATEAPVDVDAAPLGWAEGTRAVDRLGAGPGAAVAGGRIRLTIPARAGRILAP